MPALDVGGKSRPRGFFYDWMPLLLVAAACFVVVAFDIHV